MLRTKSLKPPPKPRWRRKAEERPLALYEAALDVFAQRGYRATRLEEVAAAAGVSKGTIYNYFKNKEDLLTRALEEKMQLMIAGTEAALGEFRGTATEKLRFLVDRGWNRWLSEDWGRFNKLILGEIANEVPALFKLWVRKGMMETWRLIESVIVEGQAQREFRSDVDARVAARLLHSGLCHQAFLQLHMGVAKVDHTTPSRILESSWAIILRGLTPASKEKKT